MWSRQQVQPSIPLWFNSRYTEQRSIVVETTRTAFQFPCCSPIDATTAFYNGQDKTFSLPFPLSFFSWCTEQPPTVVDTTSIAVPFFLYCSSFYFLSSVLLSSMQRVLLSISFCCYPVTKHSWRNWQRCLNDSIFVIHMKIILVQRYHILNNGVKTRVYVDKKCYIWTTLTFSLSLLYHYRIRK